MKGGLSRREFLLATGATLSTAAVWADGSHVALAPDAKIAASSDMVAMRREILDEPVRVGLHRAKVFTKVFQANEDKPWILRKAMALREYFQTVPLYLRTHDQIAGSISELPGAMPVIVELGIGENSIYTNENPSRQGYLKDQVPRDIREYWANRNMWGLYRTQILGQKPYANADQVPTVLNYKFISNQGHLSPRYRELLSEGLGGLIKKVAKRLDGETDADKRAFLTAAQYSLEGLSTWIQRYAEFLRDKGQLASDATRAAELAKMSRICDRVARKKPETFREALQLVWFVHQAIHIEGHGYSCTPDRIDQILLPFYEADKKAGRINDDEVLRLAENFTLKMLDNTFWGPEHHLTQGLCVSGSSADGHDQTNRLSWLFVEGATNLRLPEPLVWIRWHSSIDQKFFDFCLSRLVRSTCFPMMWNDRVIPDAMIALGLTREDAYNYVPVGCNELASPGVFYFNPGANVSYLTAIEAAMTGGRGLKGQWKWKDVTPPPSELKTFDQFTTAVGTYIRRDLQHSYEKGMQEVRAQMTWGCTPLTSCFFDGCVEQGHDMIQGTKYNILSCGGIAFANAVDCLAAVREVVYEKKQATLEEVAQACAANFKGYDRLRARLQAAPKQGNDDPRLDDLIRLVEHMRDVPMKEICRDPRDGHEFNNSHVVRSAAIKMGRQTPATPDGRLAGTPVASSMAASQGCERSGPTAVLNSVCKLDTPKSWQGGYQVNIRFHSGLVTDPVQRDKLRAMLNTYFEGGGAELQINVVDSATLRAAQKNPEQYRDIVVRVAGFSEFFVNLTPEQQNEIIARTEHM